MFLLVSVYFENRSEFYDLVIKRGIIMLLSLAGSWRRRLQSAWSGSTRCRLAWRGLAVRRAAAACRHGAAVAAHASDGCSIASGSGASSRRSKAVKHVLGARCSRPPTKPRSSPPLRTTLSEMFRRRDRHSSWTISRCLRTAAVDRGRSPGRIERPLGSRPRGRSDARC